MLFQHYVFFLKKQRQYNTANTNKILNIYYIIAVYIKFSIIQINLYRAYFAEHNVIFDEISSSVYSTLPLNLFDLMGETAHLKDTFKGY
jgi:hypothetical protein